MWPNFRLLLNSVNYLSFSIIFYKNNMCRVYGIAFDFRASKYQNIFWWYSPRLLNLLAQTITIFKNKLYKYCQPLPRSIRGSRSSIKEKVTHFWRRLVHRLSLPSLHYLRNRLRKSLGTCLQFWTTSLMITSELTTSGKMATIVVLFQTVMDIEVVYWIYNDAS